jgi:putative flippase GtrA
VSLATLGVSFATFSAMSLWVPRAPLQLDQLIGIIPAVLVNYFLNSYWTFRSHTGVAAPLEHDGEATPPVIGSARHLDRRVV